MSDFLDRISKLSPKRLALLALELHDEVEAAKQRAHEPIAVIGMACRFPGGADGPEAFWALLRDGRDAIREVPRDRWDIDAFYDPDPDVPARMSARSGGFLDRVDGFDPAFFGISPREALTMDPQQRLLLEVAWEALEHAGLSPERLAGTPGGVFVGVCNSDHFQRVIQRGAEVIDTYLASGNAHSVVAGRVSYFLGLQGPALSIDTACSSSLLALHVACQSLRLGESQMALAAGVNVMCSPETTIALTKGHMLAPDGRCKTFDAAADGFARGEGCGVLVLKRLSDAVKNGDRVLALIRGTAANQDGRSGGLTVPNGPAQEAVIRAALADAGVDPADIGYVEAHGTGTTLGDPIEVRALAGALGPGRPKDDPLLVGSVKTNFGHLESAAGVASVMKVILSLQHERIPAHLHFKHPSPHIAWSEYPVTVAAQGRAWPRGVRRRLAGVSSFGFSGTNAHVILEEAPLAGAPESATDRPLQCLPLSARSDQALHQLAESYASALSAESDHLTLGDVAHTAGVGRSHFGERLAVVAANNEEARAALGAFARGEESSALHRGKAVPGRAPEVVFLFTGSGAQYPGMGQLLYATSPVFRDVIDQCDALLGKDAEGRTLKTVLQPGPAENAPVHETQWTQPALFAVEYALTQLWRSWGVEPAAVIGHSVGEYIAACVAGVFTLEEGLKLIAERARLMHALPPGGSMAAVFAPAAEVAAAIAPVADRVAIAAINAADSVVVSGEVTAVDALLEDFARRNVQGHRLFIGLAGHSPLVAPALDAMEACARTVQMRAPQIPVAWNLTGGALPDGPAPDAVYWRRHLREPVRFADGIQMLHREGYRTFLEVGPHPTLIALAQRSLPEDTTFLTSLRRGKDDWGELMGSLGELYVHGAQVDWAGVDRPYGRRRVALPTYPFERRSFWIAPPEPGAMRMPAVARGANPLLGARLPTAVTVFETVLTPESPSYLTEHRVLGAALVAGPVFMEMAQACAQEAFGPSARAVEAFVVREPLVLPDGGRTVQVHLGDATTDGRSFSIHSRAVDGGGDWTLHVTGRLTDGVGTPGTAGDAPSLEALGRALGPPASCQDYYERLSGLGIELRTPFRSLQEARRQDGEALATIALAPDRSLDVVAWAHPALLDGALQSVGLAVPAAADSNDVYLLTEVERIELFSPLPAQVWCHARLRAASSPRPAEWRADVRLLGADGHELGHIRGIGLRRASREALSRAVGAGIPSGLFYEVAWESAPAVTGAARSLAGPERILPQVRERFALLAETEGLAVYDQLLPALDRLSAEHVATALRDLGFDATLGRVFDARVEAARLGVVDRYGRLFGRLLQMLVEEGTLRTRGDQLEIAAPLASADPAARYDELLERFRATDGELLTLRRCASQLARVLRGQQDPLQLLFPGGSFAEAHKLYVESPFARTYNAALGEALLAATAALPTTARLRVLEIGAGTGGTTTYLLPLLPKDRVEYTFTDMSPLFLERAAEQFGDHPFMKRALLDIERDPRSQGFDPGKYDVVIAGNVLHATADLRQALQHARSLLAPGGLLLLLEGVAPERWVDLTFGLTEGWWRFTDTAVRPHYPLVTRETWRSLLEELGFTGTATVPERSDIARSAQQALVIARAPLARRRFTLLGDQGGVAAALATRLVARGDQATILPADTPQVELAPADEVVYLAALDLAATVSDDLATARRAEALSCAVPLQWLAGLARNEAAGRAWLVTRGAQPVQGHQAENPAWQAPLWGLGRVFALEQPARWGGLLDLPPDAEVEAIVDTLLATLDADDGEDQTAWRSGVRHVVRLLPAAAPDAPRVQLQPDATYLVTGGFGGLGLIVARWMAEHGARHIALLGRRPDLGSEGVRAVEALGARVIALQGDVADEATMTTLLSRLAGEAPPLRGIVHAAAALSVATIGELTAEQVADMLRPKIEGTVLLSRLTHDRTLDFLVLFSSTTALLGASGFAHYAAANTFLDAFAQAKNRPGRRVLSVNWGTWEAMRLATADSQRSYREGGLEPMAAGEALDALGQLLGGASPQGVVARIDWTVLKPLHEARRPRPFLAHLGSVAAPEKRAARTRSGPSLGERLAQAAPNLRHDLLVEFVRQEVVAVLGLDASLPVALDTGLFDLGMDSLMSVELKKRLERGAEQPLPSTLTFNYPNIGALASFLEGELRSDTVEPAAAPAAEAATPLSVPSAQVDLGALTDEELEARLLARLEQSR